MNRSLIIKDYSRQSEVYGIRGILTDAEVGGRESAQLTEGIGGCLKWKVLFLCANNGLYGPIAEALLRRIDSEHFEALSAGISPGGLHPLTVEVMNEIGIDLTQKIPRCFEELTNDTFDYVITLGEKTFHHHNFHAAETIHWKLDNPIRASNDPEKQLRTFRMVRDQIAQRLRLFVIVHVRPQAS